jgi:hypothetical protein
VGVGEALAVGLADGVAAIVGDALGDGITPGGTIGVVLTPPPPHAVRSAAASTATLTWYRLNAVLIRVP